MLRRHPLRSQHRSKDPGKIGKNQRDNQGKLGIDEQAQIIPGLDFFHDTQE